MAKTLPSYGPSNWFFLNHNQCFQGWSITNFTILDVPHSPLFLKMAKIWPYYGQKWSSHGPSNWFFLNHNHCALGCSMQNFTLLSGSCSPHPRNGQNMALLWPKHGPHVVLQVGSSWIMSNKQRDILCQISNCCFYHVAVVRNGQNMALLWTKHGPHMVPKSGSSWFLINVPRDTQCQISHCWVYPVASFPRNGHNMAFFMAKTWSSHGPSNWFFLNLNQCAQGCSMLNFRVLASILTDIFNFLTQ